MNLFHCNITNLDEISSMRKRGFLIDFDNECYIRKDFGAYIRDLNKSNFELEIQNYYGNYLDKDYKLLLGPAFKEDDNKVGLYCSNYLELLNRK